MVSSSRKKAPNKTILFPLDRKQVFTCRNEGFTAKYVFTDAFADVKYAFADVKVTFDGSNI